MMQQIIKLVFAVCVSISPLFAIAQHNNTCSNYSIWETETNQSFRVRKLDFQAQVAELIADLETGRPYALALIQERVGPAPKQAPEAWLRKLLELSDIFTKYKARMVPADEDSADLIGQVKESLGFQEDIIPVTPVSAEHEFGFAVGLLMTASNGKRWPAYFLGIPQVGSVFQGYDYFALLHEFGHFSHGDTNPVELESRANNYQAWLNMPEVRADVEYVARCSQLASDSVTPHSVIGRRIVTGLEKRKAPGNESCSPQSTVDPYAAKERRADLFAARHLLAANKVAAMLETIDQWSKNDALTRCEPGEHPPLFERALYLTGFLVDNGIDVNELFVKWQKSATCDMRNALGHPLHWVRPGDPAAIAARQYRQAYRRWLKENAGEDYESWKAEHASLGGGESAFELHLEAACRKLEINPLDKRAQRDALFNYNYLRELQGLAPRTSFDEIGIRELFEFRFQKWMRLAEKELRRMPMKEFASHMRDAIEDGTQLREDPQGALMSYNYLRHLSGQPLVYSVEFIDLKWLKELLELHQESLPTVTSTP